MNVNILLITADDMNYDTPEVVRGAAPRVTPHIDGLAGEGLRFDHAHVTVAVCQPSRETLMTGLYPHRSGATGFCPVFSHVPTLQEMLKKAGYELGILGKVSHLEPPEKFPWDYKKLAEELGMGRDPARYYQAAREFLDGAARRGRPFFLMANSHDPHRPFAGSVEDEARKQLDFDADPNETMVPAEYPPPDRTYMPDEVVVPEFLPELPDIRREMAQYCSSARRCDQTVGEILRALREAGLERDTLTMFLSDNGISMPFAKSNCYLTSTKTPWIARWPGKIRPQSVDREHFVSGVDFMPTILEAAGIDLPREIDGESFLPLLRGEKQAGRHHVFTCYNDNAGGRHYPMRCRQTRRFGYIYNPWSDGKMEYRTEPMIGLTFPAMRRAAASDAAIAARVEMLIHRVPEEFYDFSADPGALKNLIDEPEFALEIGRMREEMLAWMRRTGDPLEERFARFSGGSKPLTH